MCLFLLAYLGFTCPPEAKSLGPEEYRYFRSPRDCQRYYICINGRPRLYNCGEGNAFDDFTNSCEAAENVTGCAPTELSSASPNYNLNKF